MNAQASLNAIFCAALEIDSDEERAAYLDRVCGMDTPQRRAIEQLLEAHTKAGSFLELPDTESSTAVDGPPPAEEAGTRIGPYKLLHRIGVGGMGEVWLAQQQQPVYRQVALKIIKPDMDTQQVIARFEQERQALALMDHVNIAKAFDAGTTENGRPFFVMELIHGVPITQYCDDKQMTIRERLELFVPVCQAIQHAHQKGVIHRDIKPSNVLVMLCDGKPVPKVIDFGVAKAIDPKLTERTLFRELTEVGALIGTLEYMSPEQADLDNLDIDTRSDIYSLGVLLYELLTGTLPLEKKRIKEVGVLRALRLIREEEPPRPSTRLHHSETLGAIAAARKTEPMKLAKLVRGELDWIVIKALEKDRSQRYETANGLARNVEHYLADEPVEVVPPSAGYRLRKLVRRHKQALAATAGALLALMVLASTIVYFLYERQTLRITAEGEQRHAIEAALDKASGLRQKGHWDAARVALEQARDLLGERGTADLHGRLKQAIDDLELVDRFELIRLRNLVYGQFDNRIIEQDYAAAFRGVDLDADGEDSEAVADCVRNSAVREQLVAALDDWAAVTEDARRQAWLLEVARRADPDPWRDRFRDPKLWADRAALEALASELLRNPAQLAQQKPQVLAELGNALLLRGASAVPLLAAAQARHLDDFWLNFMLGRGLQVEEQWDEAAGYFRAALALRPESAAAHNKLAWMLYQKKRLDEAIREYHTAIELDPKSAWSHHDLGLALRDKKQWDEAIREFRTAIDLDPKWAIAPVNLGHALLDSKQYDEAIRAFRTAIQLDPKNANVHIDLGLALLDGKQLDEAIRECRVAIELDPKDARPHNNMGCALLDKGQLDEAIRAFRTAIKLDFKYFKAHYNLGVALQMKKALDEAIREFRTAIELDPKDTKAHYTLGIALSEKKQLDEAIRAFHAAIELDPKYASAIKLTPKYAPAHHQFGQSLHRRGKFAEAEAVYREVIILKPDWARPHDDLAWLLATCNDRNLRNYPQAIKSAKRAVQLAPHEWKFWNTLGVVYRNCGKLDEAVSSLRESIRRKPDWPTAHGNLGDTYARAGQWDKAAAASVQAVELEPSYHWWWFLSAALRLHKGDLPGYSRACREMLARFGKTDAAHIAEKTTKTCLLIPDAVGDLESLLRLADFAVNKNGSDRWIQLTKALAEYRADRFASAIEWLQRVAPKASGDSLDGTALAVLAMARKRQEQVEEAGAALEQARAILKHKLPKLDKGQRFGDDWHDWLRCQILYREAETLLGEGDKNTHPKHTKEPEKKKARSLQP
jgi:tetratricopeptide (TPR) repeat protein/serine/threonine protein kinase